jgi:hypothetical protein
MNRNGAVRPSPSANPDVQRLGKLHHPALAIAEDAPIDNGKIPVNRNGLEKGYNPYDSGRLAKAIAARRRNLRRLGEWLKLRKQTQNKEQTED